MSNIGGNHKRMKTLNDYFAPKQRKEPPVESTDLTATKTTENVALEVIDVDSGDKENGASKSNTAAPSLPSAKRKADIAEDEVIISKGVSMPLATPATPAANKKLKDDTAPSPRTMQTSPIMSKSVQSSAIKASASKHAPKVMFRNGRVNFTERALPMETHPDFIKELAAFFAYSDTLVNKVEKFPDGHLPLLAKLVEESDLTLSALARKILTKLCPAGFAYTAARVYSEKIVTDAINNIAQRFNYGLNDEFNSGKASLWRWEVKDVLMLPQIHLASLAIRRKKRADTRDTVIAAYGKMDDIERLEALSTKKRSRTKEDASLPEAAPPSASKQQKLEDKIKLDEAKLAAKEEKRKLKEAADAEREAKREQRENEKLLKETELELKKEEEKKRQPTILGFFAKSKKVEVPEVVLSVVPQTSQVETAFGAHFPPFHLKPFTFIAPVHVRIDTLSENLARLIGMDGQIDRLAIMKSFRTQKPRSGGLHGKIGPDMIEKFSCCRKVKLYQFHENYRPAYFGTWNAKPNNVKGRRPYAKEPEHLDYDFESDDEWEDLEEGDECLTDEEEDDEEDELMSVGSRDEPADSWLVPDGFLSDDEGSENGEDKVKSGHAELTRNKFEVLVPVIVAPFYSTDGNSVPVPLQGLQIRSLFNVSIKFPIDMLTAAEKVAIKSGPSSTFGTPVKSKTKMSQENIDKLTPIVIGTSKGVDKIIEEFQTMQGKIVSKYQLGKTLREFYVKEKEPNSRITTWRMRSKSNSAEVVKDLSESIPVPPDLLDSTIVKVNNLTAPNTTTTSMTLQSITASPMNESAEKVVTLDLQTEESLTIERQVDPVVTTTQPLPPIESLNDATEERKIWEC